MPPLPQLRLNAAIQPDGVVRSTWLRVHGDAVALLEEHPAGDRIFLLPAGAVAGVFSRYGKPLADDGDTRALLGDSWLALPRSEPVPGPAVLRALRYRSWGWAEPLDYLVLSASAGEPVAVPAPLAAAALLTLGRAAARRTFLLFDMDGTLLRLGWGAAAIGPLRQRARAVLRERGLSPPLGMMIPTLALLGREDAAVALLLHDLEEAAASETLACDGVAQVLGACAEHPAGLVTSNGRSCVMRALARAGLAESCFGAIVCRDDVERLKPDPESLLQAVSRLSQAHGEPLRVVMIGDAATDLQAALALRTAVEYPVVAVGVAGGVSPPDVLHLGGADLVLGTIGELGHGERLLQVLLHAERGGVVGVPPHTGSA